MTGPSRAEGRRVGLGVSGSIAAYKALTIAGRLTALGAEVDVIMTSAAAKLVAPLAFQALTHRAVITDLWDGRSAIGMDHLAVAKGIEVLAIAPATANTLAQIALGLASDALTTTALATSAPLIVAPAMEPAMWRHVATVGHAATLRERGAVVLGPEEGRMASGDVGLGRMVEPEIVLAALTAALGGGDLAGRSVVVTAGPTVEPIDAVRFLSNYSSGRMGYALAGAARSRGARVTLITGPTGLDAPWGVDVEPVETALEMLDAVLRMGPGADAVVMTAAVADFRPRERAAGKLKKAEGPPRFELVANPDIITELAQSVADAERRPVLVGFAAETEALVANGRAKLQAKGLDLLVANEVPAAFGSETSTVTLIDRNLDTPLSRLSKTATAHAVLDRLVVLLEERAAQRL